jgi:putative oxidoreductase
MSDQDAVDLALMLLRCTLGAVMLAHGINHIVGGGKIAGTGRWFASMGMRPGLVHAWVASITEVGAGLLLIAGLLTPLGCAGVVGVTAVAWAINHRGNGFFIFRPGEGWEYVMTLGLAAVALGALGPGEWSLDDAFGFSWVDGWSGIATTAIAGLGGALALLVFFWRPPREESAG